jgi:hypothetical protein
MSNNNENLVTEVEDSDENLNNTEVEDNDENLDTEVEDNDEDFDTEIEDCRQKLLECSSSRLDSRCQLLDDLSIALHNRFEQLGGIEYQEAPVGVKR